MPTPPLKLYYLDGGKRLDKALAGEPKLPLTEWIANGAQEVDIETMWDVSRQCTLLATL
jgi:hypothetical protein